jgi:hypothetical protein
MAPSRPAVFSWQWPLVAVTALAIVAGAAIVIWALWS